MTTTLDERLARLATLVDEWIRPYIAATHDEIGPFYQMMAYHLGWAARDGTVLAQPAVTGKRLRPLLAIMICEALGGPTEAARGPAVAIELVHNFSLVHDDIQDGSHYRRGRETVWHLWGAAQAINVGDAMFALAQLALIEGLESHPRAIAAAGELNRTCVRLVEGQYLDLRLESVASVSSGQYEQMIARKTAALIQCACALGALAADAHQTTVEACGRFGHELGLAFQFQDDLLGVWGDPAVTGKPSGSDLRSRKKGLPVVLALELASGATRAHLQRLLRGPETLPDDDFAEALAIMDRLEVRERAQLMVDARFKTVERVLRDALPSGSERELFDLCGRLRTRVA